MLVSIVIVLIIPKVIGVHEYGLWQLFTFYAGYVGILHLGWADGLFLRRGGQKINDINVSSLSTETILFILFNFLVGFCVEIYGLFFATNYTFIITALGFTILIVNIRTWITMILQSIGNFKGYAINLSFQSLIYIILIIAIIVLKLSDYRYMIIAFMVSQFTTCVSGFIQINKMFDYRGTVHFDLKSARQEIVENINAGFKLMIANSTALLIIGVIRFGIQQNWSISIFGKVSLVLSIANFITVFINAISLVLFPTLRRTTQVQRTVYFGVRSILMPLLYFTMAIYFPIKWILPIWLPKYADVLQFSAILMPMMVYQGKFEILSNTFMKNFRMELKLMIVNLVTLFLSIILTVMTAYSLHNINYAVFSIAIVMGFRSIVSEIILSRKMHVKFFSELLFENIFIIGFMVVTWNCSILLSIVLYLVVLGVYLIFKRKSTVSGFKILRELSKF